MSRRALALALLPAGLLTVGLSVLLRQGDWRTRLLAGLEALIYLAVFGLILSRDAVRPHLGALPRAHRAFLTSFFVLLLAGHFANDTRATFPFSAWTMYGKPEAPDTLVFYRSEGIDRKLGRVVINEPELFPSIGGSSIASKVKRLAAQVLASQPQPAQGQHERTLTDWLRAVGDAYNRRHADHPIHAVELVRYTVSWRDRRRSDPGPRPVWRVDLDGGRSR